jgi:hypothetical protein
VNYLPPWLPRGLGGIPQGGGIEAKRPVPTVVPRSTTRVPAAIESDPGDAE